MYLLMAEVINVTPSCVEDDSSQSREQATATGKNNQHIQQQENPQPTSDLQRADKPPNRYTVEGQPENLLYKEDLDFVPMRQDPRYVSYRQDKSKKFDIKNEDVLHALEQVELLNYWKI